MKKTITKRMTIRDMTITKSWVLPIASLFVLSCFSLVFADKIDKSLYKKVTFKKLGGFDYPYPSPEEVEAGKVNAVIPPKIQALDNTKVAIDGFVIPAEWEEDKITELFLLKDMMSCCFGGVPALNHWIQIKMKKGTGVAYSPFAPITVYGTLKVGANVLDGQIPSIYRMEGEYAEVSEEYKPYFNP